MRRNAALRGRPRKGAADGVHFFDGEAEFFGDFDGEDHGPHAVAVGDESGCVFGGDDAATGVIFEERGHFAHSGGIGGRGGDEFEELQVAGRIKEVGAHEGALEGSGAALGEKLDLESACVGGDEGVGAEEGFDSFEEGALEVEFFDDGFANPVGFADPVEVVGDGAKADGVCGFGDIEVWRAGAFGAVEASAHALFAEVEKSDLEAEVGKVGGDTGAIVPAPMTQTWLFSFSMVFLGERMTDFSALSEYFAPGCFDRASVPIVT